MSWQIGKLWKDLTNQWSDKIVCIIHVNKVTCMMIRKVLLKWSKVTSARSVYTHVTKIKLLLLLLYEEYLLQSSIIKHVGEPGNEANCSQVLLAEFIFLTTP